MTLTGRQARILHHARRQGVVRISQLAADMGVSQETIRRDVRPLAEAGELIKQHGRIKLAGGLGEAPFERRLLENAAAKGAIARHVARMIGDGDSVMMDTGTTTSILARALLEKRGLTIVTNSSDVARTLATLNANRVYMAGGELHGDNGAAFGRTAIEFIKSFRVRFAIISISAVAPAVGPMDYQLAEAEFAATVLGCGAQRMIITDHTKFGRTALVKVCDFDGFDLMVTDQPPPPDLAAVLAAAGTTVEVASST